MGKQNSGSVIPPNTPVTVQLTLTLAEANNLLVALANAINNVGPKNKGSGGGGGGGGGGGKSKGSAKGGPKGAAKGSPTAAAKSSPKKSG
jgi:hypothetical protein